jgi:hypothetical protein
MTEPEEDMLEEERGKDADHQAVANKRGKGAWKKLGKRFG